MALDGPRLTKHKRHLDQDVYSLALERAHHILDSFDHVFVCFSGGKDSTATLHVMLEAAHAHPRHARHLPMRTVFYDEEAIPYETVEYVQRVADRDDITMEWYCLPVQHRNACSRTSPWWWPWAPEDKHLWCRPMPEHAITTLPGFPINPPEARMTIPDLSGLLAPPQLGNVGMVMGIRAQESLTRLRAVTRREVDNYLVPWTEGTAKAGNMWKAYPVYDWTTEDVWTAPAMFGWDYNRAYDRLEMAGVSPSLQRCSPAFGEEPLQKIHTYAQCFPEVWDKMVERVPGVGAAARYALTELYCYRDRPEKPAGLSWPDFLKHYLSKFRPEDNRKISNRLFEEIRRHYRSTTHPIVAKAPHPLTGVSWEWLLMIAMRGDFKNRKHAVGRVPLENGKPVAKFWRRYIRELEQIITDSTFAELAHPAPPPDLNKIVPDYAKEALA